VNIPITGDRRRGVILGQRKSRLVNRRDEYHRGRIWTNPSFLAEAKREAYFFIFPSKKGRLWRGKKKRMRRPEGGGKEKRMLRSET